MSEKISPLAPKEIAVVPPIAGVRLGAIEAGIRYKGRKDLMAIVFDKPAQVAGVFTRSKCSSAPVDWCRKRLKGGKARCVVVNSGNANAFTGKKGRESVRLSAEAASLAFGCRKSEVFLASTGVIGEPLDVSGFSEHLGRLQTLTREDGWQDAARAIMTTDTYPKLSTRRFEAGGREYSVTGMAKGAGMIAPDMATMLSFVVTDLPVAADILQKLLSKSVQGSFNAITVDSDTSTSDTLLAFSAANGARPIADAKDQRIKALRHALDEVLHELAMMVVRDGEGATKHVEINVKGAASAKSAKRIALSVANSPLVKTAVAGEDANWGRIVMAVGKAGEPAERDRMSVQFGEITVARNGERDPGYDEAATTAVMEKDFIPITIDVGVGNGKATVWTCDLTREYVAINGDYRS
ncbi:MAG: bifunctional glutamate N-acetyltransferase/amino-acid acetyltransferase ArgJ [Nitratireductor sp.]|nr:bifunctional glutamate N-acetyltransferase/amino-acid acetyltransferase ArgJ [Nitratireductor sp.]